MSSLSVANRRSGLASPSNARRSAEYSYSWNPSCHTASRALEAPGLTDDYYTQCVDTGDTRIAVILDTQVLCFDAKAPASFSQFSSAPPILPNGRVDSPIMPLTLTAVSIQRHCQDSYLALGDDFGGVHWLQSRGDSTSMDRVRWVPPPDSVRSCLYLDMPTDSVRPPALAADSLSASIRACCADSHPASQFLGVFGFGCGTVSTFDSRVPSFHVNLTRRGEGHSDGPVCGVAYSEDGSLIASGGNDDTVRIWSTGNMSKPLAVLRTHRSAVKALAWNPAVRGQLASGGGAMDGQIVLSNCLQLAPENIPAESAAPTIVSSQSTGCQVTQLLFSMDGSTLLSLHGALKSDLMVGPGAQEADVHSTAFVGRNSLCAWAMPNTPDLDLWTSETNDEEEENRNGELSSSTPPTTSPQGKGNRTVLSALRQELLADAPVFRVGIDRHTPLHTTPLPESCAPACSPRSPEAFGSRSVNPKQNHGSLKMLHNISPAHMKRPLFLGCVRRYDPLVVVTAAGGSDASIRYWHPFVKRKNTHGPGARLAPRQVASPIPQLEEKQFDLR
jgi:WD40 repeat protein